MPTFSDSNVILFILYYPDYHLLARLFRLDIPAYSDKKATLYRSPEANVFVTSMATSTPDTLSVELSLDEVLYLGWPVFLTRLDNERGEYYVEHVRKMRLAHATNPDLR